MTTVTGFVDEIVVLRKSRLPLTDPLTGMFIDAGSVLSLREIIRQIARERLLKPL
jgi:hypothetical protein